MKSLSTGIKSFLSMALLSIATLQASNSIACQEKADTSFYTLHYDIVATNPYSEDFHVEVYEYDTTHDGWTAIMIFDSENYSLALERSKAYQIWMHDGKESRVFCIEPGYVGQYPYRLHANFSNELCAVMVPESESFKIEYMTMDIITPYVFKTEILN